MMWSIYSSRMWLGCPAFVPASHDDILMQLSVSREGDVFLIDWSINECFFIFYILNLKKAYAELLGASRHRLSLDAYGSLQTNYDQMASRTDNMSLHRSIANMGFQSSNSQMPHLIDYTFVLEVFNQPSCALVLSADPISESYGPKSFLFISN
jgi:hypothetical protein